MFHHGLSTAEIAFVHSDAKGIILCKSDGQIHGPCVHWLHRPLNLNMQIGWSNPGALLRLALQTHEFEYVNRMVKIRGPRRRLALQTAECECLTLSYSSVGLGFNLPIEFFVRSLPTRPLIYYDLPSSSAVF